MKSTNLTRALGAGVMTLGLLGAAPGAADAAGFYIQEQSPRHQGMSFAGAQANPADASTIFYNPAGMTYLDGPQGQAGISVIIPRAEFNDQGSTVTTGASGGPVAPGGNDGGNPFGLEPIPSLYVAAPMYDNFWFGLGVTAPFGLANDYGRGWVGRYDSTQSELMTIDIAPSFAWRVNDKLSLGFGMDFQYAEAQLDNAIPDAFDATPDPTTDGSSRLEGDDWSTGFNAGLMYQATDATRIGAHYRSTVKHTLDGKVTSVAPVGSGGATTILGASADFEAPNIGTVGVWHDLNDKWSLGATGSWYGWRSFNEIRVEFDLPLPDNVTPQHYQNTWGMALGAEYNHNDQWTFRGGVQYDETPTIDNFRTTRTPDGDRYWLSLGATYEINENATLDLAATHIFIDDADINLNRAFATGTATIAGEIESSINIVSANLNWKF